MENSNDSNNSSHILNTSSNLLGLCFIVLTSLHVLNQKQKTVIDELTVVAIVLFMVSCILSFLSLRTKTKKSDNYEKIAAGFFLAGLISMFITIMLIAFRVIS